MKKRRDNRNNIERIKLKNLRLKYLKYRKDNHYFVKKERVLKGLTENIIIIFLLHCRTGFLYCS